MRAIIQRYLSQLDRDLTFFINIFLDYSISFSGRKIQCWVCIEKILDANTEQYILAVVYSTVNLEISVQVDSESEYKY